MSPLHLKLSAHRDFPAPAMCGLGVAVHLEGEVLHLDYQLQGPLDALRVPESGGQLDPDRLWAHTCYELFLGRAGQEAYREYNFSPTGQWAGFSFATYRQRVVPAEGLPGPRCTWERRTDGLALQVGLPMAALPPGPGTLQLALTTVLELADGQLSYWALAHPPGKPDFHHPAGFVLTLPDC